MNNLEKDMNEFEGLFKVQEEYMSIGAMKFNKEGDFIGVDETIAPCEGEKYGVKFKFKKYISMADLRKHLHECYDSNVYEPDIVIRALEDSNYYEPFYISEDGTRWAFKVKKDENGKYEVYFCVDGKAFYTFSNRIDVNVYEDYSFLTSVLCLIECDEDYMKPYRIFHEVYMEAELKKN